MTVKLQIAILAKSEYRQILQTLGQNIQICYTAYGKVSIKKAILDLFHLNLQVLIVQADVASESSLRDNLQQLRIKRPDVRVIIFAPGRRPGDRLVAGIISLGIYDIVAPDLKEDAQSIVNHLITTLHQPTPEYRSIAQWDTLNEISKKEMSLTALPRQTVIVINLTEQAGATFVATSIAGAVADLGIHPTLIEMPTKPHYFHILGMALYEKISRQQLYSYPHEIIKHAQLEANRAIIFDNIAYVMTDPRKVQIAEWSQTRMMQLILCCKQTGLVLIDGGSCLSCQAVQEMAPLADLIVVVIDPLPQRLSTANDQIEFLEMLQGKGISIIYVVNKWDRSIPRQDFLTIAAIEPTAYFPMVNAAAMYQAGYACAIPYMVPSVRNALQKPLDSIIKRLLPKEIYRQKQHMKRKRWIRGKVK